MDLTLTKMLTFLNYQCANLSCAKHNHSLVSKSNVSKRGWCLGLGRNERGTHLTLKTIPELFLNY